MPRFRNLINYDENGKSRPKQSILEVQQNDSVDTIDIYVEPRMFVQLKRVSTGKGDDARNIWTVVTNIDTVLTHDEANLTRVK